MHSTGSSPGFITEADPRWCSPRFNVELTRTDDRRVCRSVPTQFAGAALRPDGFRPPCRALRAVPSRLPAARVSARRCSWSPMRSGCRSTPVEASGELAMSAAETRRSQQALWQAGSVAGSTDHRLRHAAQADRCYSSGPRGTAPRTLDPGWEVRETGWHVSVDGDAPLEVTLRMPIPLDRMAAVSPAYTANRAVNAVPLCLRQRPRHPLDVGPSPGRHRAGMKAISGRGRHVGLSRAGLRSHREGQAAESSNRRGLCTGSAARSTRGGTRSVACRREGFALAVAAIPAGRQARSVAWAPERPGLALRG